MNLEEIKQKQNQVFAVVDCNNFFVSCERAFNPAVQKSPVLVLSNNDGCVISRSEEVKKLGIPMAIPFHKCEEIIRRNNVKVFSSNFALYSDMSQRIMNILSQFAYDMEIYSIDEAFLSLKELAITDYTKYCLEIRKTIMQWTGIPVSIGVAPTKTLAKIADKLSKQAKYQGVCDFTTLTENLIDELLENFPVEDIWGIGRQTTKFLRSYGIVNAKQLKYADPKWIRKNITVTGLKTLLELRGVACHSLASSPDMQKGIASTRSFGKRVLALEELEEAVSTYTARACEKLRSQKAIASYITVFIHTSKHARNSERYYNTITLDCTVPSSYTPTLTSHALIGLRRIFREGFKYKKAGVMLGGVLPESYIQEELLSVRAPEARYRSQSIMKAVDTVNTKYGRGTVHLAAEGTAYDWRMNQKYRSPRFTTCWEELLNVRV